MRRGRLRAALARLVRPFEFDSRFGVPAVRRVPVRRAAGVHRDRRLPGWLVPLLLALAGLAVLLATWDGPTSGPSDDPERLDQADLAGGRQLAGRACVVLASDVSSSMRAHADERTAALGDLIEFSRRALRPDDLVLVVTYDGAMAVALPPTAVRDLPDDDVPEPVPGVDGTVLVRVVEGVSSLLESEDCAATGLASVTDGEFQDDAAALDRALGTAALQRVHLLVPGGTGRPGPTGDDRLAEIEVEHFEPGDAAELGLDYGRLIAGLTGQELSGS
ncbi:MULTISPECIES: hypothetical protein [unclassified Blastococcus]